MREAHQKPSDSKIVNVLHTSDGRGERLVDSGKMQDAYGLNVCAKNNSRPVVRPLWLLFINPKNLLARQLSSICSHLLQIDHWEVDFQMPGSTSDRHTRYYIKRAV